MAVHECSTDIQNRHCKSCGVSVGKGKSYCLDCYKAKKKARNNLSSQKRRARINSLKPPKPEVIICKNCGKERSLGGYVGVIPKFCSAKCQNEFWKKDTDYHDGGRQQYCTVYFRQCKHCGASFVGRSKLVLCCCYDCKKEIYESRRLEKYLVKKDVELQKRIEESKNQNRERKCKICGVLFSPLYGYGRGGTSVCSNECKKVMMDNYKNEYKKTTAYKEERTRARHNRRIRKANNNSLVVIEKFARIEIFERDKWKCGLCGGKVNPNLKHPHPKSATLDHIIPIAQGGMHIKENVQLAHMICNSRKGDRSVIGGEQMFLIG